MKCPTCFDTALVMSDRQGFEIDFCPQCRTVGRGWQGNRKKSWLSNIFD